MQESSHPHRKSGSSRYRDEYLRSYRQGTILSLSHPITFTGKSQRRLLVGRCLETPGGGGSSGQAMVPFTADIYSTIVR